MSERDVEEYRLDRKITVEGRHISKPVKNFWVYMIQEIAKVSFVEPTSTQAQG